ncbi:MAG: hypothetical protein FJ388_23600, partial [Verrucomicrobia bacterium]|nr:hypothetical protein [Verrucomicrobiota bacterium]
MPPLILYEDDHLLAVNKPAGINTHAPDRFAQEGLHEWLQRRRGQALGIHQRLDKEVSGVIVFGKTALANAGLTEQFEQRTLRKTYLLLTASPPPDKALRCTVPVDGKPATTTFLPAGHCGRFALVRAEPETGRTHQVRVHAAQLGLPIAGDALYEKPTTSLPRLMLHAAALELKHPHTGQPLRIEAPQPATFSSPDWLTAAREFRSLIFDPGDDNAYRLISAAADGFPGATVDCYANRLLVQWYGARDPQLVEALAPATVIERTMEKQPTGITAPVEKRFEVVENGLRFLVCLDVGYSTGLFLDQRENRRRLLMMDLRGKSVLNAFAYTCGFSVAAARAGAAVTSLDLSKNYLDWGRDNFRLNGL